jgi:hypothetical protein
MHKYTLFAVAVDQLGLSFILQADLHHELRGIKGKRNLDFVTFYFQLPQLVI